MSGDGPAQRTHPGHALAWVHRNRPLDRARETLDVVRVDDDRLFQFLRSARHFAQHQDAAKVVARGNELLGDQVHPVVEGADDAEVGEPIEGHELPDAERGLTISDRPDESGLAVPRVDLDDLGVDFTFDLSVRVDLRS